MTHTRTRARRAALGAVVPLALAALVLSGCGRGDGGGGGSSTDVDDEPATGTIEIWTQGADGAELPEMFATFQAENPDVEFKMTEVPGEEFASKVTAAIAAGTVPDLMYIFTETQPGLLASEGFEAVPDGLVDEDAFFDSIWDLSVVDDTAYGVPWYAYARFTMYRTDLFEAAGAPEPTTWDSLREAAEKLKASGVEFPLVLSPAYDMYTAWALDTLARGNGGGLLADDRSAWTINSPENVEALEFYAGLVQDGLSSADGPQFLDTVPWVSNGQSAVITEAGPWFRSWFDDANGQGWGAEHLGFIASPAAPGGTSAAGLGGGSWFVPTDADNKAAAWKFVRWMSEPSSQVEWYKIFGNMPTVESAWDDPVFQDDPMLEVVRAALDNGVATPAVSTWNEVGAMIGQQIEKVVRGSATAQEALDQAQQQAESIGTGG